MHAVHNNKYTAGLCARSPFIPQQQQHCTQIRRRPVPRETRDDCSTVQRAMSTSVAYAAFIAVAIVLHAHTVNADTNNIECYVCNSHNDTACAQEKVPERFKMECSKLNIGVTEENRKNYTICRKIIQTIEPEVNGLPSDRNRIIRTCGWDATNYINKCYHRSGFGGKQDVCTCTTNYCNSAQKTYMAFATVIAASFAILIL